MTPADRFDDLVAALSGIDGVSPPAGGRRLGAQALRRDGRIVALLAGDRLAVKLPRARVDELVAAGAGSRFDAGRGRPLAEWFVLAADSAIAWRALAGEAVAAAAR
jgi:hypothetical protein